MHAHKLNSSKAQVSLEYLVVVGMILAASVPVWMFAQNSMSEAQFELDASTARAAAEVVAGAADWAVLSGYPARKTVEITLPRSIENAYVSDREVRLVYWGASGLTEAYSVSDANLTGAIPIGGTKARLVVAAMESPRGNVSITSVG
ncbi:MAG: hypothetical protein WC408_04180 [Candidatus Micrarchaeia archaeon]|jgi:type II secretory pathway pseudopilin PulG